MAKRLSYKLKLNEICGILVKFIENHITDCKQKVALNGQTLSCDRVLFGVSQELVLEPLSILIYTNDFPDGISIYLQNISRYHVLVFKMSTF